MGHKFSPFLILALAVALLVGSTTHIQAQATKRILEVAILDFNNSSNYKGKMVERRAADALAMSLASTAGDYYSVISRSELQKEIETLGLSYPLDKLDMVRLGRSMGLDGIITGTVIQVQVTKSNGATQAGVMIACQMLDISTEEPITGTVVTGKSSPKYDYTGDVDILVDEAIDKAAYQITQHFISFAVRGVPEFTILTTMGGDVLLNAGSRQGIKVGMEMVVLRQGEKVGRIKVKEVTLTDATATILEAPRGIQGGDKARIVYEMPPIGKAPLEQEIKNKATSTLQKTLPALLLAFGIYKLMEKGSSATAGPRPSTCYASEVNGLPIVHLSWDYRKIPNPTNIAAIMVYRTQTPSMPSAPASIPGDSDFYLIYSWRNSLYFDNGILYGGSVPPNTCDDSQNLPATITRYVPSDDLADLDTDDITTMPLIPGRTYYYYVIGINAYCPPAPPDGEARVVYQYMDPISLGRYTPVVPPTPALPVNGATILTDQLSSVTFQWLAVAGANEYVVEVSTDPSFPSDPKKTLRSKPQYVIGNTGDLIPVGGLTLDLSRFKNAKVLYWRVGAINKDDTQRPPEGYVFRHGYWFTINIEPGPPSPP
ncbi:hypothetical protein H5T87_06395 [bacterium]|nr:hypothetical protein [bacterium]